MFSGAFGWPHLLAILAIVILLFGATRLPALARSVGQSMKIFREEVKTGSNDSAAESEPDEDSSGKK
ncbi:twin-arginine translocase TatA/TatE family subunit [Galbitalea sp. SE-J8]|uniref:twin-arginine translocase TatA/TatE family subunit n=1 Tax=Galbitalea sp. SE-J8 TaxID=3054952 RepID=UPI00259C7FA8|nr:twin-arginine translocase TatA/TatE family subunit [Galbitalea sp. SE-J8]MDM4764013.1 twin-arginine translocase TatA/TatE family subunit [Galbitalea sp. SE-J8]